MGIYPELIPGDDCLACYAGDITPKYLFFCVTGIQKGGGWNPGDGEPANGIHLMTQMNIAPCIWRDDIDVLPLIEAYYAASFVGNTRFQITNFQFFAEILGIECVKEADSEYVDDPFTRFFGGHAIISDTWDGDLAEYIEVANQVVVPIVDELRFERFPCPPDHHVYRMAGCFGKTNIKVKKKIP